MATQIGIDGTTYDLEELTIIVRKWRDYCEGRAMDVMEAERIVMRLKNLLDGQTDTFTYTGKVLRTEILGEQK